MMGHRERLIDGDEYDALSRRARKFMAWRAGQRKRVKAKVARRARKEGRFETIAELDFEDRDG